ncbi:TlpA family protein disulfide reductase [Aliifodinibius salicampi]|uniref:TlpA family protein disulfide reductase n=1 Tax=Fodinibius salicampi TaxID=1920655 RepID=A0ABT3PZA2_9BACT|nr:TlpA disulfide reductase family protein [Fodinibius salicampi]MCW9713198.1 TlpA family protein disulfide reductase [Fodinibius salicampi]
MRGALVSSEKIDITQPFLINGNTYEVSYIDSTGFQIFLQPSNETEAPVRGLTAPNFQATDLEGNEHNLHSYFGEPVLLEFWSKYCPYCKEVRPDLNQLQEEYCEDFTLMTMARETDRNELKEHLKKNPKQGIFVLRNDEAWNTFNPITATPTFYLIDSDGTIKMKGIGAEKIEVVEKMLQNLL